MFFFLPAVAVGVILQRPNPFHVTSEMGKLVYMRVVPSGRVNDVGLATTDRRLYSSRKVALDVNTEMVNITVFMSLPTYDESAWFISNSLTLPEAALLHSYVNTGDVSDLEHAKIKYGKIQTVNATHYEMQTPNAASVYFRHRWLAENAMYGIGTNLAGYQAAHTGLLDISL